MVKPKLVEMKVHKAAGASCQDRSTRRTTRTLVSIILPGEFIVELTQEEGLQVEADSDSNPTYVGVICEPGAGHVHREVNVRVKLSGLMRRWRLLPA